MHILLLTYFFTTVFLLLPTWYGIFDTVFLSAAAVFLLLQIYITFFGAFKR